MKRGITITNYLVNGNPEGVILAYMSNWTGQAIKIPRNLFPESKEYEEINRPGIYFLIGQNEDNPDDKIVYIGEANNISERLIYHIRDDSKSFFDHIVAFSSKDENLTVSHTKYLELKLIDQLSKSTDYRTTNRKEGNNVNLPRMVIDEMDTYLENIKILIPTLGFDFFKSNNIATESQRGKADSKLLLEVGKTKAESELTSNGLLVMKGSYCNKKEANSLSGSYSSLRKILLQKAIIQKQNEFYVFMKDYEFSSPSQAAAIILGYPINGRTAWKNKKGESLKKIEDRKLEVGDDG